jgi:ribosomal-protein-alanine N-acetyltransferase
MELKAKLSTIRPWRRSDKASLLIHADNPNVARGLGDQFPHPYTPDKADWWFDQCEKQEVTTAFALEVDGQAVGGIGVILKDNLHNHCASIGYWLGESLWGKGIVTDALKTFTPYAFEAYDRVRLQASVFPYNSASCRVLEKAGYAFEARLRCGLQKAGKIYDELLYVKIRGE